MRTIARALGILWASVLLTSCATPYSGPTADVSSTLVALETVNGLAEANPLLESAGLYGGAVISLGLRAWIVHSSRGDPECEFVAGWTSAIGWGAACNNAAVALGAMPIVSIPLLIGCAIVVKRFRADATEAWCGNYIITDLPCNLRALPEDTSSARCIDNYMALREN